MTATVKANSDGSADLLVNAIAAIHMAADGGVSFPEQGQSLALPGYVKLPGGLIVQWGGLPASSAVSGVGVAFPIVFPNAVLNIQLTNDDAGSGVFSTISVPVVGGFTYSAWSASATRIAGRGGYWIAIGH